MHDGIKVCFRDFDQIFGTPPPAKINSIKYLLKANGLLKARDLRFKHSLKSRIIICAKLFTQHQGISAILVRSNKIAKKFHGCISPLNIKQYLIHRVNLRGTNKTKRSLSSNQKPLKYHPTFTNTPPKLAKRITKGSHSSTFFNFT